MAAPAAELPQSNVSVVRLPPPKILRSIELAEGVRVDVLREGDGQTMPSDFVEAHVVGRLPTGCVFESTEAKGQDAMRMDLKKGAIIPGMEIGIRALSLGAVAEIHVPARLGYMHVGIPRIIPPNSDLVFQVEVLVVDGVRSLAKMDGSKNAASDDTSCADAEARSIVHPWWLARVERPKATAFYRNFCRHLARGVPAHVLARALPIPRKTREEAEGWDLTGSAMVLSGVQDGWRAKAEWDLDWFKQRLGSSRQMVKWHGPVFTKQENLWDLPVWECSLSEYIDYVKAVDAADPNCQESNAEACPRLYLNGWPAFKRHPWLREYVSNPTFFDDCTGEMIARGDELREHFVAGLSQAYKSPPEEERRRVIDDEYWEFTKVFISPRGALTRLHYDNGGAHVWLTQIRGRKLFVCYPPSAGADLHPFEGDEGLLNGSWIDPLDEEVDTKWPDYAGVTPYIAVVEEGETLVAPQGWWHYTVAMDTSITIMRNFFSEGNRRELERRKDEVLQQAMVQHVLKARLKNQPDSVLMQVAKKAVDKIRANFEACGKPPSLVPHPGGPGCLRGASGGS